MPRRANLAVALARPPSPPPDPHADNLALLRSQWRWAAFSQFYFTFSPLFPANDISIADIEHDLVHGSRLVTPRIMQRLLYTLSYDRKVTIANWQTALRKQYHKRDPRANPIGPEPVSTQPVEDDQDIKGEELDLDRSSRVTEDRPSSEQPQDKETEPAASCSRPVSPSGEPLRSETATNHDPTSTRQTSLVVSNHASNSADDVPQDAPQQESIDWFDLPMLSKLESLHTLTEWQFQNATRLRMIMKSDDEFASWRIEPIGYDSKSNAYWFIGTDRLWIQRVPPKPPRHKALKRKRTTQKPQEKPSKTAPPSKRIRLTVPTPTPSTPSGRSSRAAKDQAKKKLDAQARELAELNRLAGLSSRGRTTRPTPSKAPPPAPSSRAVGTRASARLRGPVEDDEWQLIPDEWLEADEKPSRAAAKRPSAKKPKTGLESDEDSVSDLTELSEEGASDDSLQPPNKSVNGRAKRSKKGKDAEEEDAEENENLRGDPESKPGEEFVEWETICATLHEWETVAERFERATHYSEKALYKVLVNEIVPMVTQELTEIDRKRQMEDALVHRKRSSRLAVRENEKEEARQAALKKHEEEEKMSRARRLEIRQQKEEAERLKREHAREQRVKEREAREESRRAQVAAEEAKAKAKELAKEQAAARAAAKAQAAADAPPTRHEPRKARAQSSGLSKGTGKNGVSRATEEWELACEICNRQGINLNDSSPVVSCGICARWQHIECHDRADHAAGRSARNWKTAEFICSRCRATQRMQYSSHYQPQPTTKPIPMNGMYGAYAPIAPSHDQRPASYYPPGYMRDVGQQQQSYYRLENGHHEYMNGRTPGPMYGAPPPPTSSGHGHGSIAFSHYQPADRAFTSGAQKVYAQQQHYRVDHHQQQAAANWHHQHSASSSVSPYTSMPLTNGSSIGAAPYGGRDTRVLPGQYSGHEGYNGSEYGGDRR